PCQNGGHWTGTGCLCPPNVDGARCQFGASTINITAELGPSVMLLARVTNRKFSGDMRDASSVAYRSFVDEFSRTMDRIYRNVSGYRGTRVLSLTRGSVVVNYKVLLHPPAGDPNLAHRALELLEAANTAAQPQNCSRSAAVGTPWGAVGRRGARDGQVGSHLTHLGGSSPPAPELCRKYAPANFSRYYYPYRTQSSFLCVTNCTLNVPGSIDCNRG
ncbi:MUC3B protein, partial [Alopecoenas beccarii]|nr:MUC3B protein [Alopecoenas beccarii]